MNASNQITAGNDRGGNVGSPSQNRRPHRRLRQWLALALMALLGLVPATRAATLVHDFYLPMPEAQIRQTFSTIETNVGTTLDSVFSVVVTGPEV